MTARSRQPMSPLTLASFTDDELQAELERRKVVIKDPLENPDFSSLRDAVLEGVVKAIQGDGFDGDDFPHTVFEAALEAVYGPDVWDWFNNLPGNR